MLGSGYIQLSPAPETKRPEHTTRKDRELCSQAFNSDVKAGAFYGDLWAEALAIDIFSLFLQEEAGPPNISTKTC